MSQPATIDRVILRHYRSIAECDVVLGSPTWLVGRNGAGKSNFLDSLHFVKDALGGSLDRALGERGGIASVRRRSDGHPATFRVHLEFTLPEGGRGIYEFEIGSRKGSLPFVRRESLDLRVGGAGAHFTIEEGELTRCSEPVRPILSDGGLGLVQMSGLAAFHPAHEMLSGTSFILGSLAPAKYVEIRRPIHTPRDRFLNREDERRRILGYAGLACTEAQDGGRILVLFDADDDCPVSLSSRLATTCERIVGERAPVSVVLANREYEAWFLASCETLEGVRDFHLSRLRKHWDPDVEGADPDVPRNAKGLIGRATGRAYGETADQAALSARIDIELARDRSRSFRTLVRECERVLDAV